MKTTKELRKEIYDYLNKNVGNLTPIAQQTVKSYLYEFAKLHDQIMIDENNILKKKLAEDKVWYNEELNKLRETKEMGHFNYLFLKR